jgi:hypothetical protein
MWESGDGGKWLSRPATSLLVLAVLYTGLFFVLGDRNRL